jgi:protein-disulfide isomerase
MTQLKQNRPLLIVAVVAVVAVVAIVVWQLLAVAPSDSSPFARYTAIPQNRLEDGGFVLGNPEAPITVIEFADFACPHCQEYSPAIHDLIDEFVATGKAKLEYRMFISAAIRPMAPTRPSWPSARLSRSMGASLPGHDAV